MAGSEPAKKARSETRDATKERRLIEAAQADPACFVDLYEKYFEVVYAYVARRMPDRASTEDLTSELFRKALGSLPRFKWTGAPFGAWLIRIAANMIADRAKRAAREVNIESGEAAPSLTVKLSAGSGSTAPQAQQSDLEDAERRAELFKLVDGLSDDQRRVVVMRFAEEKSIREIADTLGRSEGAVKQLQLRALQTLRKKILTTEDTGEDLGTEITH